MNEECSALVNGEWVEKEEVPDEVSEAVAFLVALRDAREAREASLQARHRLAADPSIARDARPMTAPQRAAVVPVPAAPVPVLGSRANPYPHWSPSKTQPPEAPVVFVGGLSRRWVR